MRKVIISWFTFLLALQLTAQQPGSFAKDDYLKKNKTQKTVAWSLLGGGILSVGLGFATLGGKATNNTDNGILLIGGTAAMVTSIPFFISASKNKKKAATLGLKLEQSPVFQRQEIANRFFPAASLSVSIK